MAGHITCNRCGATFLTEIEVGFLRTNGEICPTPGCRDAAMTASMENPPPPPPPQGWAVAEPRRPELAADGSEIPDLQSQLEDLFGAVWTDEANERLNDRINLSVRNEELKKKP